MTASFNETQMHDILMQNRLVWLQHCRLHSADAGSYVSQIIGYPTFSHTFAHYLQGYLFQTNSFRPRPLPSKPSLIHQSFDPI
jgi:hypothetical protein